MEYQTLEKTVNRTRVLKRTNAIAGMTKYGVDHFSLKNAVKAVGRAVKAIIPGKGGVKGAVTELRDDVVKDPEEGKRFIEGSNTVRTIAYTAAAIATGGALAPGVLASLKDKKDLAADQTSSLGGVVSSHAGGTPVVNPEYVTTATKAVNTINKAGTAVEQFGKATGIKASDVVTLGKQLINGNKTGTQPTNNQVPIGGKTEPVQTEVVQAGTPTSFGNMTVIYIAIGAIVLVVLFSQSKS